MPSCAGSKKITLLCVQERLMMRVHRKASECHNMHDVVAVVYWCPVKLQQSWIIRRYASHQLDYTCHLKNSRPHTRHTRLYRAGTSQFAVHGCMGRCFDGAKLVFRCAMDLTCCFMDAMFGNILACSRCKCLRTGQLKMYELGLPRYYKPRHGILWRHGLLQYRGAL